MSRGPRVRPQEDHPGARGTPLPTRVRARNERAPLPADAARLPALPLAYERVLDAGLAELDLELEPPVRAAIADHVRLLLAWTTAINLTAIRDATEVARLHVLDSLAAVPVLRASGARSLLDLGSGGGMPGLPIALALPADRALLVDAVAKKVRFLETVIAAVGADARVSAVAARAEELAADPRRQEAWDAVTARAVGPLDRLVDLALPFLRVGGRLVAWKRGDLGEELRVARQVAARRGAGSIEVLDPGIRSLPTHRLVVVTKERPSPMTATTPPRRRR